MTASTSIKSTSTISTFDLFKIGIGPSSSHTVGPMRAAHLFLQALHEQQIFDKTYRVKAEMFGSLGSTGKGHGTPKAVLMGLEGEMPETVDVATIGKRVQHIRSNKTLSLDGKKNITFHDANDLLLHKRKSLPLHPNGMKFSAYDESEEIILEKIYYSVGGGFVLGEHAVDDDSLVSASQESGESKNNSSQIPYPFDSAKVLLDLCQHNNITISELMLRNECATQSEDSVKKKLLEIWEVMKTSVDNGCHASGVLPGGLNVPRRAPDLFNNLHNHPEKCLQDPLSITDWVTLYALAVNEENAAGGRIVTAPTNGAAGIIPAVMHYYFHFVPNANEEGIVRFLLTAAAIGTLYKMNASISGAEVGCQGEVGSACSMAAGALCEVMGGTPAQVENAAEIAMEHNLGLTCDPIGGLVQVPCIERNAMASIKAISACRMALQGNGSHFVSLDKVIKTMRITGRDMRDKYKETARGGLAVNVLEVPVNIIEC